MLLEFGANLITLVPAAVCIKLILCERTNFQHLLSCHDTRYDCEKREGTYLREF
jgi:hypothetical protein